MPADPLPVRYRGISNGRACEEGGGLEQFVAATGHLNDDHNRDLAVWLLFGDPGGDRCATAAIWRTIRDHAVGTPIPGHDVSETGWQTLGRAMQSITTMMPV
jgi:hypothetical protein